MKTLLFCSMLILGAILLASGQEITPKQQQSAANRQQVLVVEEPVDAHSNKLLQTGGNILEVPLGEAGSMYLDDEFHHGTVVLIDNSTMDNLPLRYNVYYQQMQFIKGEDTLAFKDPEEIKSLRFNGRTFIYIPFDNDGVIGYSYFELMADGYCRLLVRRKVDYHEILDRKNCDQSQTYIKTSSQYLQKQGEPAQKCIKTSKGLCSYFKDEEEEMLGGAR